MRLIQLMREDTPMPFMPDCFNVVILYGNEAISHFDSLIQYWSPFFTSAAWSKFLFICVSSDGHAPRLTNPPAMLSGYSLKIDPEDQNTWAIPATTLDRLQTELPLHHNRIMVHCICADYAGEPTMPAQVPVHLLLSIYRRLTITNTTSALFMMLHESPAAVAAQRALVEEIVTVQQGQQGTFAVVPYFVCPTDSDGARYSESMLWRCLMCEMLVISCSRRPWAENAVYTLGYAILNADDSELTLLREQAVCDVIAQRWAASMSHEEAWWLLTRTNVRTSDFTAPSMDNLLMDWLKKEAARYLPEPKWDPDGMNLCILQHIDSANHIHQLLTAVQAFFCANRSSSGQRAREVIHQYVLRLKDDLVHVMNIAQFPQDFLAVFFDSLGRIANRRINEPSPYRFPDRTFLQSMEKYLHQCFDSVTQRVRALEQERFAIFLAQLLVQEMKPIRDFLASVSSAGEGFQSLMAKQMLEMCGTLSIEALKDKYPPYVQQLNLVLKLREREIFSGEWFASQPSLIAPAGALDPAALRTVIVAGEKRLHQSLSPGFDKGFIIALKAMLGDVAMDSFLENNLQVKAPLLQFINVGTSPVQNIRLADVMMKGVIKADFFIDNDNIEQIQLFRCQYPLAWYVSDDPAAQKNAFLCQAASAAHAAPAPDAIVSWKDMKAPAKAAPVSSYVPVQPAPAEKNPHKVRLIKSGNRWLLVWEWMQGMETASVQINNQQPFPHDISKDPPDVTNLLSEGRNDIRIFHKGALYAECSLLGKRRDVPYTFLQPGNGTVTLKISNYPAVRPEDLLFLRCVSGDGKETLYPIAGDNSPEPLQLKGLRLSGKIDVVSAPYNPFPRLLPQRQ